MDWGPLFHIHIIFCYFDFILVNPPYVASRDIESLMPEVKNFEPRHALDGGYDGLNFYRRIIPLAGEKLNFGGYLIMEVGDGQWAAVSELLEGTLIDRGFLPDYSGKPRAVFARKENNG